MRHVHTPITQKRAAGHGVALVPEGPHGPEPTVEKLAREALAVTPAHRIPEL
jgi:hypothetical protein